MKRRQFICSTVAGLVVAATKPVLASQAEMIIYKDPTCGCCHAWAEAMIDADFAVTVRDTNDLASVKQKYAIPAEMQGCHTAIVEPYYFEGHVPVAAVENVLSKRPDIAGLAVPGMPSGSLGMGNDPNASYDVFSVPRNGGKPIVILSIRPV
ncbi:hypothetical protein ATY75_21245 [Rhizobium sp. N122]|uniref:DUF411 domain-containing protein n=1 Tax=Rhizobium sp. N122 TaxID=1764272 RepID=UPI000B5A297B|nr:DUF411 domain-containing protein [Rhizobium sp. N122]OWV87886.1 hypothetical protein ATY75_21245 [Rhizobium sp. N122]